MATGESFWSAAEQFRQLGETAGDESKFIEEDWSDAVKGGSLEATVRRAVSTAQSMREEILKGFSALEELCQDRANDCDNWDGEIAGYNAKAERYLEGLVKFDQGKLEFRPTAPDEPLNRPSWYTPSIKKVEL